MNDQAIDCPACGSEISKNDVSETTVLEDHGVCWWCHRQMLCGERCRNCYESGHALEKCPDLEGA